MTGAQSGQGGGHGEAQAEAAWCQGEGGKSDPEGQEPLSSLHMILGEERRREERSEETDFIKTDFQNRKKKYLLALTPAPTHHQRAGKRVLEQDSDANCPSIKSLQKCHCGARRSPQHTKQLGLSQVRKSYCGLRENLMGKEKL